MEVDGVWLYKGVDHEPVLGSADLGVIAGSHVEHVVPIYHELAVSGQAQQGTHALHCDGTAADGGEIGEGLVETYGKSGGARCIGHVEELKSVLDHSSSNIAIIAGEVEVLHFLGNSTGLVESDQQLYPFGNAQVEPVLIGDELIEESGVCADHREGDPMLVG